jgi:trehalose 6-phosphate phosphatase
LRPTPSILAPGPLTTLNGFARSNVLLAFDYDGTLAPIAATPRAARMREDTRRLLARVAHRYPCVVISGRSLADLEKRLDGIPLWTMFGNHGIEARDRTDQAAPLGWSRFLARRLQNEPGLLIEDKEHSITIHYREVADKPRVRAAIDHAIAGLPGARALAGIEAISVLPRDGRHKGIALQEALHQFGCDTAVYVGDDETDEDAFQAGEPGQLLSIRIGWRPGTTANYCLHSQEEIDAFLEALLVARDERRRPTRLRLAPPARRKPV